MLSPFDTTLPSHAGDKKQWGQLPGASAALLLALAAQKHQGPSLVITPTVGEADKLQRHLRLFLAGSDIQAEVFADWETLPYDSFSPHQDIISDRMRCLYKLASGEKTLVIVAANENNFANS